MLLREMNIFFRRSRKANSCGSLNSTNSGDISPKDKPKFMSRFKKNHNPLGKIQSLSATSGGPSQDNVKHRPVDVAKALRRRVVTRSVASHTEVDCKAGNNDEKKNKKKLRNLITSVYQDKGHKEEKHVPPVTTKGPVFGVPLSTAVQRSRVSDHLPLCRVFHDTIMFIETFALQREGIYRVPGFRAKLNELKIMYNKGEAVKLTNYDPETVGMLLKLYLRELPEPLLTRQLGAKFEGVLQLEDEDTRIRVLCGMLRQLPAEHYATLAWLCLHICHVCNHSNINKMTITNLIIILSPTLLISNTLLRCLCENAERIFPGVVLDPNRGIPTQEELGTQDPSMPDKASQDHNLKIIREDLVQSFVWAQARNDALTYVKDQLKAQLREERRIVLGYEDQLRDLEDQDYVIGETVVLRRDVISRRSSEKTEETEEDLRLYLSTLEQENHQYESDKTDLYNTIISETLSCIETYTEIRFRQTFSPTEAAAEA